MYFARGRDEDQLLSFFYIRVPFFFFVLTDSDGKQQFGFTKRIFSGTGLPQSICMLTHRAWTRLFARILDAAESRLRVSWSSLQSFLSTLYNTKLPAPGMFALLVVL